MNRPETTQLNLKFLEAEAEAGRWEGAETVSLAALATYQRLGQDMDAAATCGVLGNLYRVSGRWEEAETVYQVALATYQRLGQDKDASAIHLNLGILYEQSGRWEEAEVAYQEALSTYEGLGQDKEVAAIHGELASLYRVSGRWEEAEAISLAALATYRRLGHDKDAAAIQHSFGILYGQLGRWKEAEAAYQAALTTYRRLNLKKFQAKTHQGIGALEWARGDREKAGEHYTQAMELFCAQGLHQNAAWAAYRWGRRLCSSSPHESEGASLTQMDPGQLHQILNLVVPAAIMLDAVRFEFRNASDRIRWGVRAQQALDLAILVAADLDRSALVAELIETRINATTHSTGLVRSNADVNVVAAPERFASFDEPVANAHIPAVGLKTPGADAGTVPACIAAGSSRLVAGARLPAGPPPLLNVPTDTTSDRRAVALAPWLENYLYRPINRPPGPIDTW